VRSDGLPYGGAWLRWGDRWAFFHSGFYRGRSDLSYLS